MSKKSLMISFLGLTAILVVSIVVGIVVVQEQQRILEQFEFSVYPKPQLTEKTLRIDVHFVRLPEEGASFDSIVVDGFIAQSFSGQVFKSGDDMTLIIQHDGKMKSIPEEAVLWYGEIGFKIKLRSDNDGQI